MQINNLQPYKADMRRLLLVALLAVGVYTSWSLVSNLGFIQVLLRYYDYFTGQLSVFIASWLGYKINYDFGANRLIYSSRSIVLHLPYHTYPALFASFALLILIPPRQWISRAVPTFGVILLLVALRGAALGLIELLFAAEGKAGPHRILVYWLEPAIFITVWLLFFVVVHSNAFMKGVYHAINERFRQNMNINFFSAIACLILLPPLPRVIFSFIWPASLTALTNAVLSLSVQMLHWIGISCQKYGNMLVLDKCWITLEHACLGLGTYFMIMFIIIYLKGKLQNKIFFLLIFFVVYQVANAMRLSFLLLYLHLNYQKQIFQLSHLHSQVSVVMYVIAFLGLWIYMHYVADTTKNNDSTAG